MKRLVTLFVALAFASGTAGFALAQTAPATADKPAEKAGETKKPEMKKAEPKMTAKSVRGTVKSAGADSFVVTGKEKGKDAEWTFAVDAKTTIKKGGKAIMAADLKAGDSVQVRYMDHDGKAMAQSVMAKAGGMEKKAAEPAAKDASMAKKVEKPAEKK